MVGKGLFAWENITITAHSDHAKCIKNIPQIFLIGRKRFAHYCDVMRTESVFLNALIWDFVLRETTRILMRRKEYFCLFPDTVSLQALYYCIPRSCYNNTYVLPFVLFPVERINKIVAFTPAHASSTAHILIRWRLTA